MRCGGPHDGIHSFRDLGVGLLAARRCRVDHAVAASRGRVTRYRAVLLEGNERPGRARHAAIGPFHRRHAWPGGSHHRTDGEDDAEDRGSDRRGRHRLLGHSATCHFGSASGVPGPRNRPILRFFAKRPRTAALPCILPDAGSGA